MLELPPVVTRSTVTPCVVARDCAAFLDFAVEAFDAIEDTRSVDLDGRVVHAELAVGETVLLARDERPELPAAPACFSVLVEDVGAVLARALEAGATPIAPPGADACVVDPVGNLWWIVD